MKKYILLLFVIVSSVLQAQQETGLPAIESPSKLSFTETIDMIKSAAEKTGWKVLIVHNLQESLRKNGQDVLPVSVIELCKPEYSGALLKNDDHRFLSVFMPCRVSVYEKSTGEIFISRMNTAGLTNSLSDKNEAVIMINAAKGIEEILAEVTDAEVIE